MYTFSNQFSDVVDEVIAERKRQLRLWGDHIDNKNTPNDWMAYVFSYVGKALTYPFDPERFRESMINGAALCIAAAEWCDRVNGKMPKRHYDKKEEET